MLNDNNELLQIKKNVFRLINNLEDNISNKLNKRKIDSQSIFALTKLVDSFVKIVQTDALLFSKREDPNLMEEDLIEDDKNIIAEYKEYIRKEWLPGPDSNQRPSD